VARQQVNSKPAARKSVRVRKQRLQAQPLPGIKRSRKGKLAKAGPPVRGSKRKISLILRKRKLRRSGKPAAGANYQEAYNQAFNQAYDEGFGKGFEQGLQEGLQGQG
jgi:flagellar biosynthesis/type III secretory pathway protein FliH